MDGSAIVDDRKILGFGKTSRTHADRSEDKG